MTKEFEIEIDDFSTNEIIAELRFRINRNLLDPNEKNKFMGLVKLLKLGFKDEPTSLADQMKIDFFQSNIHNISLEKLEALVK